MGDPSCFEPDVEIEMATGSDHFYALVYERLWDTMLPALEKVVRLSTPVLLSACNITSMCAAIFLGVHGC